jgi:SH3 domain protein
LASARRVLAVCLSAIAVAGLSTAPARAEETQYVSDSSYIPLRTGQSNQHRIRMNLKTGDKLTVMETSEDTEWSHVKTEGGTDGWVQSQYLTKEAPAKLQLEYATQKLARVEQQLQELKQQNRELTSSNNELTRNVGAESQSRSEMAAELQKIKTLSADAIALEQRFRELEQKNGVLSTQAEKLTAENTKLKDDQRVDFMVYGVGILLCGVLLAIVVPALKPKKRQSEWR